MVDCMESEEFGVMNLCRLTSYRGDSSFFLEKIDEKIEIREA